MIWAPEAVVILSGSGSERLAEELAGAIGLPSSSSISASSAVSGECQIQLGSNVRGRHVCVVQATGDPVNDHLIELALILSACKRASAARVHAIIPYLAYGRQTKKAKSRVPVSAADVAAILEEACVDAVVTVDVHSPLSAGFYSPRCAFHNAKFTPVAARFLVRHGLSSPVVVAPHASTVALAMEFLEALIQYQSELGMYSEPAKRTASPPIGSPGGSSVPDACGAGLGTETDTGADAATCWGSGTSPSQTTAGRAWSCAPSVAMLLTVERRGVKEFELTGDVAGRDAVLVDDIIDSGNTFARSARELMARGAARVFAFATHGLLSSDAAERLARAPIDLLVVTNTVSTVTSKLPADHKLRRKMAVLSVAPMLAHYVCEHAGLPVPDIDPMVPRNALHSGRSAAASPSYSRTSEYMSERTREMNLEDSDTASQAESQTTASELSGAQVIF